ncbi:UNVERIFIED_CONTAM: hypothetical protein HDU68_009231, partial [Siphonaria sp. JEL0065]
ANGEANQGGDEPMPQASTVAAQQPPQTGPAGGYTAPTTVNNLTRVVPAPPNQQQHQPAFVPSQSQFNNINGFASTSIPQLEQLLQQPLQHRNIDSSPSTFQQQSQSQPLRGTALRDNSGVVFNGNGNEGGAAALNGYQQQQVPPPQQQQQQQPQGATTRRMSARLVEANAAREFANKH